MIVASRITSYAALLASLTRFYGFMESFYYHIYPVIIISWTRINSSWNRRILLTSSDFKTLPDTSKLHNLLKTKMANLVFEAQQFTGLDTSTVPSLAFFQGTPYLAFQGNGQIIAYSTYNGTSWTGQQPIPGRTSTGVSLALFQNKLYAAWKGEENDQRIFYSSYNGTSWADQQTIPGNTSTVVSLTTYQNKLYGVWKGEVNDQRIFYSNYDGTSWAGQQTIGGNTSTGVSSAASPAHELSPGELYFAWKGEVNDSRIFWIQGSP